MKRKFKAKKVIKKIGFFIGFTIILLGLLSYLIIPLL